MGGRKSEAGKSKNGKTGGRPEILSQEERRQQDSFGNKEKLKKKGKGRGIVLFH